MSSYSLFLGQLSQEIELNKSTFEGLSPLFKHEGCKEDKDENISGKNSSDTVMSGTRSLCISSFMLLSSRSS